MIQKGRVSILLFSPGLGLNPPLKSRQRAHPVPCLAPLCQSDILLYSLSHPQGLQAALNPHVDICLHTVLHL